MLTIHHLSTSQSDRVVWLAEELEVPYTLRWHDRGPDGLMPPDYLALHPAATAPVIDDDGLVLKPRPDADRDGRSSGSSDGR